MDSTPTQGTRVLGAGPELFERAADRLARLRELGAQGGLALPERLAQGPTSEVVVQEQATGVSLAAVMARRGALPLGECVGMGVRVAHELARLHSEGMVHGALDARAVLVDRDVRLTRLLDGVASGATAHDAPGDVRDLGVLLMECVQRAYASRLGAWVEPMIAEDATRRPSAATVAKALLACAPPAEVTIPVGDVAGGFREAIGHAVRKKAPNPATKASVRPATKASVRAAAVPAPLPLESGQQWRRASRRRRLALWAVLTIVVLGGLGAAMWRGIASSQSADALAADAYAGRGQAAVSPPPLDDRFALTLPTEKAEDPEDAVAAARRLTEERIVAIALGDPERLISLTVPGMPAHRDAVEAASAIRNGELAVENAHATVGGAQVLSEGPGSLAWVLIDYEWAPGEGESALLLLAHTSSKGWLVAWATDAPAVAPTP